MESQVNRNQSIRPLSPDDLGQVVAIDALIERRSRRNYVERRLAAARREPALHAQFAATDGKGLAGYILARVLEGEFGRRGRSLRLELIGVRDDAHGHGVGKLLFQALADWAGRHHIDDVRTAATWTDAVMLHWLGEVGFRLAPNYVLDCSIEANVHLAERDDALGLPVGSGAGHEISFGPDGENDYERLARDTADVRTMTVADLPDIVRIDRAITARDRAEYLRSRLAEATDDSSLRVSLTARRDGANVGYLMARVDRGDFGRTEPVAIIDTFGVDPESVRHGVGRALLSQLFTNLGALHVERVETVIAPSDQTLFGFLISVGFEPSQRLAFVRTL